MQSRARRILVGVGVTIALLGIGMIFHSVHRSKPMHSHFAHQTEMTLSYQDALYDHSVSAQREIYGDGAVDEWQLYSALLLEHEDSLRSLTHSIDYIEESWQQLSSNNLSGVNPVELTGHVDYINESGVLGFIEPLADMKVLAMPIVDQPMVLRLTRELPAVALLLDAAVASCKADIIVSGHLTSANIKLLLQCLSICCQHSWHGDLALRAEMQKRWIELIQLLQWMTNENRHSSGFNYIIETIQESSSRFAPFSHAVAGQSLMSREVESLIFDAQGALDIKAAEELLGEDMLVAQRDHEVSRDQFSRWNRVLETRAIRAVSEAGDTGQQTADRELLTTQSAGVNQHWIAALVPHYPTYVDTERRFDLVTEGMTVLCEVALAVADGQVQPATAGEVMSHINEALEFNWAVRTTPCSTGHTTIEIESRCMLSNGDRIVCILQLYCK